MEKNSDLYINNDEERFKKDLEVYLIKRLKKEKENVDEEFIKDTSKKCVERIFSIMNDNDHYIENEIISNDVDCYIEIKKGKTINLKEIMEI